MQYETENIDIIKGCRRGDRRAQEQLYKSYYKTMMALCLRYTRNEHDAVEALNTGFLKVFQNIHRYEPAKASLYTWVRTLVLNSCLDQIKSRESFTSNDAAADVQIDADVLNRLQAKELLALVRSLPPATAAVFNLYAIEGYQHKEIARLLNISEGTSKWHLSEARKKLQQQLQQLN